MKNENENHQKSPWKEKSIRLHNMHAMLYISKGSLCFLLCAVYALQAYICCDAVWKGRSAKLWAILMSSTLFNDSIKSILDHPQTHPTTPTLITPFSTFRLTDTATHSHPLLVPYSQSINIRLYTEKVCETNWNAVVGLPSGLGVRSVNAIF